MSPRVKRWKLVFQASVIIGLAIWLTVVAVVLTNMKGASAAESADLTFAREQLRNCQLLQALPNLTSAERNDANRCVNSQNKLIASLTAVTPSPSPSTSSASPSPSPTTPQPSPTTTTVTPSPTPTPSPTITGPTGRVCAPFPAMPDATCTGVPPGVTLHGCSNVISVSGTYDSCLFSTHLQVNANNVTITRSRVMGRVEGSTMYSDTRNLKLVDVEINGGTTIDPNGQAAIGEDGYSCLRCYVHHTGRGANAGTNVTIQDSYFADFGSVSSAHITAVGSNGGQHSKIIHNRLICNVIPGRAGGCSAAFSLYGDFGPIDDWLVQNNSFASPQNGFCTYAGSLPKPYPHATNTRYIGNRFGPCPQYGAVSGWENNAGNVWSDNRWQDGTLITV